ncbi:30S ribosomal protein S16 [Candidatus Saccharibacteria bacterium]|nr:30S ribosomal protein S16 [Candidatus Saccharibacteria bacterium]
MLVIRLKRYGKTHFTTYRVVVQEAAKHPSSGKVIAYVGNYNPHTKTVNLDQEQIEKYLSHGAQPSPRVIKLLKDAKIKLPNWVREPNLKKTRTTRHPDKLRKNRPAEVAAVKEVVPEEPAEVAETPAEAAEAPIEEPVETSVEKSTEASEPVKEKAKESTES